MPARLEIEGGVPLLGTVKVSAAKNAALPAMAAALLTSEPVTLANAPDLADVRTMGRLLETVGARVSRIAGGLRVQVARVTSDLAPYELVSTMRASVLVLGPLVARHGTARVALGTLLTAMGARIQGAGTARIEIEGVVELGGAVHRVVPDRVEAGTLIVAAAITGGDVTVTDLVPDHISSVLAKLDEIGVVLEMGPTWVRARCPERPRPADVTTSPFPGFPTDMQA